MESKNSSIDLMESYYNSIKQIEYVDIEYGEHDKKWAVYGYNKDDSIVYLECFDDPLTANATAASIINFKKLSGNSANRDQGVSTEMEYKREKETILSKIAKLFRKREGTGE